VETPLPKELLGVSIKKLEDISSNIRSKDKGNLTFGTSIPSFVVQVQRNPMGGKPYPSRCAPKWCASCAWRFFAGHTYTAKAMLPDTNENGLTQLCEPIYQLLSSAELRSQPRLLRTNG
jgi:hypothetical protein